MIKGCFLTTKNMEICKKEEYGIYKKIMSQYSAFKEKYDMMILAEGWKKNTFRKMLARLPFFPNSFSLSKHKIPSDIDFLFFRFDLGDRQTINFLKGVKIKNPNCKIIIEVPTYPLQWEKLKWYTKITKPKHSYCESKLKEVADVAVVYDKRDLIFGIETIKASNGLMIDNCVENYISKKDTTDINVLSVSSMSTLHGLDRFIDGMGQYYLHGGKRNIYFHIVGNGSEMNHCHNLVNKYSLQNNVFFYGYKVGDELSEIRKLCDVGVDMLGGHRIKDANFSSTLKSREYWAEGKPIISSAFYSEEVSEISDYIYRVPSNETPVNISDFVGFYDRLFDCGKAEKKVCVGLKIQRFAKEHYDIRIALLPIFDYINNFCKK